MQQTNKQTNNNKQGSQTCWFGYIYTPNIFSRKALLWFHMRFFIKTSIIWKTMLNHHVDKENVTSHFYEALCSSRNYPYSHHRGNFPQAPAPLPFQNFHFNSNPPPPPVPPEFPQVLCTPPYPLEKNSFGKKMLAKVLFEERKFISNTMRFKINTSIQATTFHAKDLLSR